MPQTLSVSSTPLRDARPHPPSGRGTDQLLRSFRRIALLTEGHSTPFFAKTAINLLRYRTDDVAAVIDGASAGLSANRLFGVGGEIPVVCSLREVASPDALFVGIAPPGGRLPAPMRRIVAEALAAGLPVVSGLHDFVGDDPELAATAKASGAPIIDVRRNAERVTGTGAAFREACLRIHTVGHDCSVGKMVTALEVQRGLSARGVDARFLATGQTGIMIDGDGVPVDCVVSDFVNGAVEQLVLRNQHHEVVVVEGQGCITHPAYSGVTLGLLHGCAPDGLLFCYELGRTAVKTFEHVRIPPIERLLRIYETLASERHPCKVIGLAINSRGATPEAAAAERERARKEFGLPVCDVVRDGPGELVDAVLELRRGRPA